MKFYILPVLFFANCLVAHADGCRVIEHPDRDEVVCENIDKSSNSKQKSTQDQKRKTEIELILERLKDENKSLSARIDAERDVNILSQLYNDKNRNLREIIFYNNEYAELTIKNPKELALFKQKSESHLKDLQNLFQKTQAILSESTPSDLVKISSIKAYETNRGYSYAYFSIKADVDNRDSAPHQVFFIVQAKSFDGHVLDSVSFNVRLDKKETKVIAEEKMIRIESIPIIKNWEVSQIKVN